MSGYALKAGWLWEDLQAASQRAKVLTAEHHSGQARRHGDRAHSTEDTQENRIGVSESPSQQQAADDKAGH